MKPITASISSTSAAASTATTASTTSTDPPRPITKTTLEDWTATDDDVNNFHSSNASKRPPPKKRRKKTRDTPPPPTNWDDVYDPSRPNSYEEYREGDEKVREMQDWRERVYGRREEDEDDWERDSDEDGAGSGAYRARFRPPNGYSFAPPPVALGGGGGGGGAEVPPPPPPPPAEVPDDVSGEDAYARRIRMSQTGQAGYTAAAAVSSTPTPPPPPPPSAPTHIPSFHPPPPPPPPEATISRAPVLYTNPASAAATPPSPPTAMAAASPPSPDRSTRPGKAGFAQRLMSKYGWTSGTGLGADSSGIVQPLRMVATSKSSGRGKIVDRNSYDSGSAAAAGGKYGKMSEVVVLESMVDGLQDEDEAVLLQEIGDECEDKYGKVERVLVHWSGDGRKSRVFVQFTSGLSALRAVQALEGRLFNGNRIGARYFDRERFENRDLDFS